MAKTPVEYTRVFIILVVGMITALWIQTNYQFNTGMIYLSIGVVAFLIYKYTNELFNGKR
jgi:hypothetical protein